MGFKDLRVHLIVSDPFFLSVKMKSPYNLNITFEYFFPFWMIAFEK